jgi:tRNA U54 and U55 pseudouridine synthase Pus10
MKPFHGLVPDDPLFEQPRLQKMLGKPVRESKIEDYLHKRVKALGGEHRRLIYAGRRGATDDLILLPGRHMVIECKRPGKPAEDHQSREHSRLVKAGFEVHVVSTFAEIDAILPLPLKEKQ